MARLLAAAPELNLFAAAPDIETDEYVVRHVTTHAMVGLQVKSTSVDSDHPFGYLATGRRGFHPAPSTWVLGLAELRGQGEFHDECLLLSSEDFARIASQSRDELFLPFHPGASHATHVDPFRLDRRQVAGRLGALLGTVGSLNIGAQRASPRELDR